MNPYNQLEDEIDTLRRQWHGQRVLLGILVLAAAFLLALSAASVMDNVFRMGTGGRFAAAMTVWILAAAGLFQLLKRCVLVSPVDDFFATLLERKHSGLKNLLINAVQLGREEASFGSPQLVDAIVRDAGSATADIDWSTTVDSTPLKRGGLLLGAVLLLVLIYGSLFTPYFSNGISRVLLPLAAIEPYTRTQIPDARVRPGDVRIPEGATVVFEAELLGEVPDEVLWVREWGGKRKSTPMVEQRNASGRFVFTLVEIEESLTYSIEAGDGRSSRFGIEVVARPRVALLDIAISPPAYAASTNRQAEGSFAALPGSRVRMRVIAGKPLQRAALVLSGVQDGVLALHKAESDSVWETEFLVWSDAIPGDFLSQGNRVHAPARFFLKLVDTEGYENREPVRHTITLLKDQSPSVTLPRPGRDLQLNPDESVSIAVQAGDDYGLEKIAIHYRVNDEQEIRERVQFPIAETAQKRFQTEHGWAPADNGLGPGDLVHYWAVAFDRNDVTGPGRNESRRFTLFLLTPELAEMQQEIQLTHFAEALQELLRQQRKNRAETEAGSPFDSLVEQQVRIRILTGALARAMEEGALPLRTVVDELTDLHSGLMAETLQTLESGRDTEDSDRAKRHRSDSLPLQDEIIARLESLLQRLQHNEEARKRLKKIERTDKPSHEKIAETLGAMLEELGRLVEERDTPLAEQFEKLPKRPVDELQGEVDAALEGLDRLQEQWGEWAKGTIDDLTKMPSGFIDDFDLRPDVKRIFEEIEKAAGRSNAEKVEVPLEDSGATLATKMLEDLDMWMADSPDSLQWIMEEPMGALDIPEMPLPSELVDMMGELLQEADAFDAEAEDMTSAWGDNLNQAGWGVADGPISTFSAKGVTGNDLPNQSEISGRSGDGRRGKSSGQAVGDSWRALEGRDTPARLSGERYEEGTLKQLGQDDPKGVTGGGKKAGAGETGLQGGTPPDFARDMKRLKEWQTRIREKTERIAKRLELSGRASPRLQTGIAAMRAAEQDYDDLRYEDAARRRRIALSMLNTAMGEHLEPTGIQHDRARRLPAAMREELVQATEEAYPAGYEELVRDYFRALSESGGE